MTKTELIAKMADDAKITKSAAAAALESLTLTITKSLKAGKSVTLTGFGTFAQVKRKARTGRNPSTGAAIKIKASKSARFSVGKRLKDALN